MSNEVLLQERDPVVTVAERVVEEVIGIKRSNLDLFLKVREGTIVLIKSLLKRVQEKDDSIKVNTTVIESVIKEINDELGTYIDQVLHNKDFQRIEGTWTGIKQVVDEAEKKKNTKISILNADKSELAADFENNADLKQSKLYLCAYGQGQGPYRGTPYGAILLDCQIDPNKRSDLLLVEQVTELAKFGLFPVFAGVSPRFFFPDDDTDVGDENTPKPLTRLPDQLTPNYFDGTDWDEFRKTPNSFYLGLLLPRYLGRNLYGKGGEDPGIAYTEKYNNIEDFLWVNPVYAMGYCLARSFNYCGWFHSIWGDIGLQDGKDLGGAIGGLPNYMFSDIGVNASIATEFQVIEPHSYVLAELGFISLVPDNRQTNRAVFLTAPSVHKFPAHLKETNTVEEWNYSLNIHLPYRFIACRIAHYAKALFRGLRGQYGTVERINTEMQRLMDRYIEAQHLGNQQLQARFPIRKARTTAKETGRAGVYEVVVEIEPITQITEVGIVISLTSVADDKP